MKFPGKLEAGLKSGILTDSKYIRGTYIVFPTFDDMYELSFKNCACNYGCGESVLIEGVKCFLVENTSTPQNQEKYPGNNEYRWDGNDWKLLDAPIDSEDPTAIYARQNGKWVKINLLDLNYFNVTVDKINEEIATKQNQLVDGKNIKTFYGESLLIDENNNEGETPPITDLQVPVATTEVIGGLKSGEDIATGEDEKFFRYEVSINSDTEIGSVKIPSLTSTTTAQELIDILEQGDKLILNGGNAPVQGD